MKKYYNIDERLNVSRGLVLGTTLVHRCGYNPDVDTSSDPETIWSYGGLYPWSLLANAEILTVTSSNTADTMNVTVIGLDENLLETQETITLNGTTPVTGEVAFKRVNDLIVTDSSENVGEITAYTQANNSNVVAHIPSGEGQSLEGFYTIPANKTGYLYCGDVAINRSKEATIKFYVRELGSPFRVAHIIELSEASYRYDYPFPVPIPSGADVEVRLDNANDNNIRVSCNFDILLLDNISQ